MSMKKVQFILSLAVLAGSMASCVVSSSKYEAVVAERDSLVAVANTATTDYEASLKVLNEIEDALSTIRESENIIMMESQEGNTNYTISQIEAIDRSIQQNKAKIAELEQQLAESGSKSKQLNATINRLKNELNEKDVYINNLREELNVSQAQVAELTGMVEDLNRDVQDLNENINTLNTQNAEQQATIQRQETTLNTVYYMVAPIATLAELGLAEKGGLFTSDKAATNLNKDVMISADKRNLHIIPLNTKKATILTNHPESSYQLTKNDEKMLSLEIIDSEAFWNISNYLIISIK